MTDSEIVKAIERLKNTKDFLREKHQEQVKKLLYPELKPIEKQTYEDNKKAFNIAIKALEEFNRQTAEIEFLKEQRDRYMQDATDFSIKVEQLKTENELLKLNVGDSK